MLLDLADADWPRRAGLAALTAALGADNIRWVGGAVRDSLLGVDVHDVDCATLLIPAEVVERCAAWASAPSPPGSSTALSPRSSKDGPVEVTTLRRDVATDGRRATIAFASDWPEDAARRDFTINALYAHPETLVIADYFGGLDDLAARRVRFIGDPRARIAEDYLRILRYYRFQARFGAALDEAAEEACAELAHTLKGLSRERIAAELLALLALPDPHATVERMRSKGVLGVILPEACPAYLAALARLIAAEAAQGFAPIRYDGSPRYSRPHPMLPRRWQRGCDCRKPSAIGWSARRSVPRLMPTIRTRSPTASPHRSRSTACSCWGTTPVASPIGPCPSSP